MDIASFNHRIIICTSRVDVDGDSMQLKRATVFDAWARVETKKRSTFTREGYASFDDANRVTHRITLNWRPDVDYSVSAWVYEELLLGSPKWYKVIADAMTEDGQYSVLDCLLYQRSAEITEPAASLGNTGFQATPKPAGLKL